jgi:energy-coupling factor transporter ATP-binding protein EcfA2
MIEMVAKREVTMTRDVEYVHRDPSQQISMRDVWREIKAMFVPAKS